MNDHLTTTVEAPADHILDLDSVHWFGAMTFEVIDPDSGQILGALGGWQPELMEDAIRQCPEALFLIRLLGNAEAIKIALDHLGHPHFFGHEPQPAVIRIGDFPDCEGKLHSVFLERGEVGVWLDVKVRFKNSPGRSVVVPRVTLILIAPASYSPADPSE